MKSKFESMWRLLGKLTQIYFWLVMSLGNGELKKERENRSFPFTLHLEFMRTYLYVCDQEKD